MHAIVFGASRGCGYHAAVELLSSGWTCTLLLRRPGIISCDPAFSTYITEGRARLVKGDAFTVGDVRGLFQGDEKVDLVISSIGGNPSEGKFSLRKGLQLPNPDITTRASLVLLSVLESLPYAAPRLIVVSSTGLGKSHSELPLLLQPLYGWILAGPHEDKVGLEYSVIYASRSMIWPADEPPPKPEILPAGTLNSIKPNFLPELIIVRPALLTDGKATGTYRTDEHLTAYTISRADIGRFIATQCVPSREEWVNKAVAVGY